MFLHLSDGKWVKDQRIVSFDITQEPSYLFILLLLFTFFIFWMQKDMGLQSFSLGMTVVHSDTLYIDTYFIGEFSLFNVLL